MSDSQSAFVVIGKLDRREGQRIGMGRVEVQGQMGSIGLGMENDGKGLEERIEEMNA